MNRKALIAALPLGLAACDETAVGPDSSLDLSAAPPIRTSADSYRLETDAIGWQTMIPFTYRNESRGTYFLVNCGTLYDIRLERWDGSRWVFGWGPVLPLCLSPVMRIESGTTFADTLWIFGGFPDGNTVPRFASEDPAGQYRIVIRTLGDYDEDAYPFGPLIPVEQRVSNSFLLVHR